MLCHVPKDADAIWNRACLERGGIAPCEGDIALAAALLVHGLVMNGGVLHALGCLSEGEVLAACAGFRYFGFEAVATLLADARSRLNAGHEDNDRERRLDEGYTTLVPNDRALFAAFERSLTSNRSKYSRFDDA
jgi:hypothetical protein